jgi:hypothetical protein
MGVVGGKKLACRRGDGALTPAREKPKPRALGTPAEHRLYDLLCECN